MEKLGFVSKVRVRIGVIIRWSKYRLTKLSDWLKTFWS